MKLVSYPSIYALGHKAVDGILSLPLLVEEKVDGSQFSFGLIDGELFCRSKKKEIDLKAPESLFSSAVDTVLGLAEEGRLTPGATYRCEFLGKPKHNVVAYNRTPEKGLVVFDVMRTTLLEDYEPSDSTKKAMADALGLECVPTLWSGKIAGFDHLKELLETESFLGGVKVEGVVLKAYGHYSRDKKTLMAKFVSEAFKEKHAREWKSVGHKNILEKIIDTLRSEARWQKAVQHLRELGTLENSPKDIGLLIQEIKSDILEEEQEYIAQALYEWALPTISRRCVKGFPEWYKEKLAKEAFEAEQLAI